MEDIQDLLDCNGKSDIQQKGDTIKANIWKQNLKQRLEKEKVTHEKQKNAADNFFQAIGEGLPCGTKDTLLMIQSMQDCVDVHVAEWKNITKAMIL